MNAFFRYFARRTFQVLFSLLFSIGPFILISTLSAIGDNEQKWYDLFQAFFANGQVAFMTISIAGLIVWNGVFLHKNKNFTIIFILCSIASISVASWFANRSISGEPLLPAESTLLWLVYIMSLVVWWAALMGTESDTPENFGVRGEKRLDALMKEVEENDS